MKHTIKYTDVEDSDIIGIVWPNGHRSTVIKNYNGRWEGTLNPDFSPYNGSPWGEPTLHGYLHRAFNKNRGRTGFAIYKFWSKTQLSNWMKAATNTNF